MSQPVEVDMALWMRRVAFAQPQVAETNLQRIRSHAESIDQWNDLQPNFARHLATCADPDMALNNVERLIDASAEPVRLVGYLHRRSHALAMLVRLMSASQYFSDVLIRNPEYFERLQEIGGQQLRPVEFEKRLLAELEKVWDEESAVMRLLRIERQWEMLRIGYRDIVLGEPLELVTASLSDLADGLVEAALQAAIHKHSKRFGTPRTEDGATAQIVVLGMGKLGGRELNYSSDIDLIVIYDREGTTDGRRSVDNAEFFAAVTRDVARLLSSATADGRCYRVDLRLRPLGDLARLCLSLRDTLAYYDKEGRTWERQALVKARPVAGSAELGGEFLRQIEPFIYRRFLSFVEINEVKAIKRRIEANTTAAGQEFTDLKTGRGGIRDIEFVLQFLQLVNGGARPELRQRNTLVALRKLTEHGCINRDEQATLESGYRFLRKAEHRLQFMFDLQAHAISEDPLEQDKLAIRMGYSRDEGVPPGKLFLADLRETTDTNRAILQRLMHEVFAPRDPSKSDSGVPETDLMLDPEPTAERIQQVLSPHGFTNVEGAYANLVQLAREDSPFLSSTRCRHFLASIAPRLLREIAKAPDPDMALVNLEKVTQSLGAKGVLWESFSFNPQMLRLYVQLCSWSQFLSGILINNPGMIDELLDILVMNRQPTVEELDSELDDLLRGAEDPEPILHGFRNTRLLAIGVQDVLGKSDIRTTTRYLSELAEVIIRRLADMHWRQTVDLFGLPMLADDSGAPPDIARTMPGRNARYAILGMGKFGGGELSYHSDLDLVLVYEGDGRTEARGAAPQRELTDNFHFFSELAQRIVRTASRMGPLGRLYPIDLRLRPTGGSGSLVVPFEKFLEYYQPSGGAQLWEFQALTRARLIHGDPTFGWRAQAAARRLVAHYGWKPEFADDLLDMRKRLEESRGPEDVKRGSGGLVDVEFSAQLAQLRFGAKHPEILEPNVWRFLERMAAIAVWTKQRVEVFREGYTFLHRLEARQRIVYNQSTAELPKQPEELRKLALRMGGYDAKNADEMLTADLARHRAAVRAEFLAVVDEARRDA